MKQKAVRSESGMMTVEAVLVLVPFILVILGIISFINIFAVHNKVQYSLHQMASELSCYTYFYQALGVRAADLQLKSDIDVHTENVDTAIEQITEFFAETGSVGVGDLVETGRDLISDPKGLIRGLVYLGIEKGEGAAKSWFLGTVSKGLMEIYLDEGFAKGYAQTADDYLKKMGVKDGLDGLDFGQSDFFNDDKYRMIDIVVEYEVEVYFFKLFLKDPYIHVVQRCAVPAWLDGDGVSYSGS